MEDNPYEAPPDFEHEKKPLRPGNALGCLAATCGFLVWFGIASFITQSEASEFRSVAFLWIVPVTLLGLGFGIYALRTDERVYGCLGIVLSSIPLLIALLMFFG